MRPNWIVNCTGPGRRRVFGDPLLGQMLADDLATPEPLGLGIRVEPALGVVGRRGDRFRYSGPSARSRAGRASRRRPFPSCG